MNRTRVVWVFGLLVALSVGAVAYRAGVRDGSKNPGAPGAAAAVSDALNAELERIRTAEKIRDPYERCMAYPNPAEFNWSPAAIETMCRRQSRRMLGWKEIEDALNRHHPEIVDQAFESYLSKNYAEPGQHGFLTWTYWWMFQSPSKWTEDTTNHWVESDPNSAYALAARGIHLSQAAYDARGGKRASETPAANFERMHELVERSRRDLERSLELNPRLIAAYHGLLHTSRLVDDPQEAQRRDAWIEQALALDPDDQWIYQDWMDAVDPSWGGSVAEMESVADQAARRADTNPALPLLKASALCAQADEYRCESCSKDGRKSLDLYRKAAAFGPAGCFLEGAGAAAVLAQDPQTAVRYYSQAYRFLGGDEWLAYRAQNLRSIGRGDWALQNLNDALARNPGNTTLLYALALAYVDAGRYGDAEKTYRDMLKLEPGNQTAALELARLYLSALNAPDKARPLIDGVLERDPTLASAWFLQATLYEAIDNQPGYRDAAAKFLRYANRTDPWQATNISIVEAKLRQIAPAAQN